MVLYQRLQLKQRPSLIITPQLQQAIKLLQMSAIELQSFIDNELRENPLLTVSEEAGAGQEPFAEDGAPAASAQGASDVPAFDAGVELSAHFGDGEPAPSYEEERDTGAPDKTAEPGLASGAEGFTMVGPDLNGALLDGEYDPFATLSASVSLHEHLRTQAQLAITDPTDRFIADYLIDLVDAAGYIRQSMEEVRAALGADAKTVERVLGVLQTFDPPGICARNLAECLALQLKEKNRLDPCMQRLLDHLDLLAASNFARLKKLCDVDSEDLADMIKEIRALDPKPGAAFDHAPVQTLVPDVIVKKGRDGNWSAELNPAAAPSLAVDRAYYESLKRSARTEADRSYLKDRRNAANWLVNSLEQRLSTILKVANALVEEQTAFFERGVRHLKPLNLRQIAQKIGMHESTVSRVTSNKAMATPRGLFEMKYFFTSAIASANSFETAHSSEAVRDRIKELILKERPDQVLSDDRIVSLLQKDGIEIARRTVAKYREALRIPSSAMRRRLKRAGGTNLADGLS